jgi:hypothetical protein
MSGGHFSGYEGRCAICGGKLRFTDMAWHETDEGDYIHAECCEAFGPCSRENSDDNNEG